MALVDAPANLAHLLVMPPTDLEAAMARKRAILEKHRPDQRFLDSLTNTFCNCSKEEAHFWLTLEVPDVEFVNFSVTRADYQQVVPLANVF